MKDIATKLSRDIEEMDIDQDHLADFTDLDKKTEDILNPGREKRIPDTEKGGPDEEEKGPDTEKKGPDKPLSMPPPLPSDLDEEISALYRNIPEIGNHFTVLSKIGEGAFSTVYKARLKHYPEVQEHFALKHIVPTSHPSRIENELRCLLKIGGRDNVMGVKLCLRNRDHVIIVMPLFLHDRFQDLLPQMCVSEAREYMRNLLIALRRVHEFNVIHRDIKPSNFLYSRQRKEYALVDFGLASGTMLSTPKDEEKTCEKQKLEKTASAAKSSSKSADISDASARKKSEKGQRIPLSPSKKNKPNITTSAKPVFQITKAGPSWKKDPIYKKPVASRLIPNGLCDCYGKPVICQLCVARSNQLAPRAGTAGFRSLEVLLKSTDQDTGVDVWSAGVIFLSVLSGRYPFFRAQDDMGYLAQIISLLGSDACVKAALSFDKLLTMSEQLPSLDLRAACLKLRGPQMSARSASNANNKVKESWASVSNAPFDLLHRMLDPNPKTRITSKEALEHPFFSETETGAS